MDFETKQVDDVTVLYLEGELGLYDAPELRDVFKDFIANNQLRIIINCKDLTFMDSSGLGALIAGQKEIEKSNGELVVCETPENIYTLMKMVGLHSIFVFCESEAQAFHKLQQ